VCVCESVSELRRRAFSELATGRETGLGKNVRSTYRPTTTTQRHQNPFSGQRVAKRVCTHEIIVLRKRAVSYYFRINASIRTTTIRKTSTRLTGSRGVRLRSFSSVSTRVSSTLVFHKRLESASPLMTGNTHGFFFIRIQHIPASKRVRLRFGNAYTDRALHSRGQVRVQR